MDLLKLIMVDYIIKQMKCEQFDNIMVHLMHYEVVFMVQQFKELVVDHMVHH